MPIEEILRRAIPWKVIAASPDMMDVTVGNRRFPYIWRSSLAISVYEPPVEDEELQERLCGQKLTFVKVSCSITGYRHSSGETSSPVTFGNEPVEELDRLAAGDYLGCYGALLNVAFFPQGVSGDPDLARYPRILDFSPKSRELVRGITEEGEVLTGSSRDLKFDESRTTTEKSETSVGLEAQVAAKAGPAEASLTGKVSHTWGTTQEDKHGVTLGSGETRGSKERYSTSMDQLYSLLTGYHTGTNRATFILLARPGTLQPTSHRTFVQGLRMLEGVQDFVIVVSRPDDVPGLCIEAALDTGHFPEDAAAVGQEPERTTFLRTINFLVRGGTTGWDAHGEEFVIPENQVLYTLPSDEHGDWIIDRFAAGAVDGIETRPDMDRSRIVSSNPTIVPSDGILVHPDITRVPLKGAWFDELTVKFELETISPLHARGGDWSRGGDWFRGTLAHPDVRWDTLVDKDFIIHARRRGPAGERVVDPAYMLVTRRSLTVCFRMEGRCPVLVQSPGETFPADLPFYEVPLPGIPWAVGDISDRLYSSIQSGLGAAAAASARGEHGVPFSETNHFARVVAQRLPHELSAARVGELLNLNQSGSGPQSLGTLNIGQILSLNARSLSRAASTSEERVTAVRAEVLRKVEHLLKSGDRHFPLNAPTHGPEKPPPGKKE